MAGNNNPHYDQQNLILALALQYINQSWEQIRDEHLSEQAGLRLD